MPFTSLQAGQRIIDFPVGSVVRIGGLQTNTTNNGRKGTVLSRHGEGHRHAGLYEVAIILAGLCIRHR